MTLNARFILKCALRTSTFVAGFGFDHTHRCSQREGGGVDWRAKPPLSCGQLTRCFCAVAELLVGVVVQRLGGRFILQGKVAALIN